MNQKEQITAAAKHHELLWRLYGSQHHYNEWQRFLSLLKESPIVPQKETTKRVSPLKGRASPLKGRKLSPEHLSKLRKPKTEEQKKALRVPKRNTERLGRYERTPEIRKKNSETLFGKPKSKETIKKFSISKTGTKNHKYKTFIFAAEHPIHGMFFGDRLTLHKMFPNELPLGALRTLAIGEKRTYKGWRLVQKSRR